MAEHSWFRIHKFLSICRHCGTLRTMFIVRRREQWAYDTGDRYFHTHTKAPPCSGTWPEGLRTEYRAAVEAAAHDKESSQ